MQSRRKRQFHLSNLQACVAFCRPADLDMRQSRRRVFLCTCIHNSAKPLTQATPLLTVLIRHKEIIRLERLTRPRALARWTPDDKHAAKARAHLPHRQLSIVERRRDESSAVGREGDGRDLAVVRFEDV